MKSAPETDPTPIRSPLSPTARAMMRAMRSILRAFATELGWRPSVTLEQGLEKTVQWYLDNEDLVARAAGPAGRRDSVGNQRMKALVFGKTGQVATELAASCAARCDDDLPGSKCGRSQRSRLPVPPRLPRATATW